VDCGKSESVSFYIIPTQIYREKHHKIVCCSPKKISFPNRKKTCAMVLIDNILALFPTNDLIPKPNGWRLFYYL
jgi:hypothetical protein